MKRLDFFPHILPKSYLDRMVASVPSKDAIRRWVNIPAIYDIEKRLKMMDEFEQYQQVLTLSMQAIEYVVPPDKSPELARLANDGMDDSCARHPDRFPAWVASVPMNNLKATLDEIARAVEKMGAKGIQIFTNINGRPLDNPEFAPIFEKMHSYDLLIWMHPTRGQTFADYPTAKTSRFDIW